MNKNFNRLPRKKISSGKVTGKISHPTDLDVILDSTSFITDELSVYPKSKFQFSDFYQKTIQDKDWITKPRFLLEKKQGQYYKNTKQGCLEAFYDLISYYYNLDEPLQRLYDGYHDSMFIRFVLSSGMMTTQHHWEMVLRYWENAYSTTVYQYLNYVHPKYDFTSQMPYTVFFDTHFSKLLFLRVKELAYKDRESLSNPTQLLRYDQMLEKDVVDFNLTYEIDFVDLGIF